MFFFNYLFNLIVLCIAVYFRSDFSHQNKLLARLQKQWASSGENSLMTCREMTNTTLFLFFLNNIISCNNLMNTDVLIVSCWLLEFTFESVKYIFNTYFCNYDVFSPHSKLQYDGIQCCQKYPNLIYKYDIKCTFEAKGVLPCNKCTFKVQLQVYIYTLYILYTIIQNLVLHYPIFFIRLQNQITKVQDVHPKSLSRSQRMDSESKTADR